MKYEICIEQFLYFLQFQIKRCYVRITNLDVKCSVYRCFPRPHTGARGPGVPGLSADHSPGLPDQEGGLFRRRGDRGGEGVRHGRGHTGSQSHPSPGHARGSISEEEGDRVSLHLVLETILDKSPHQVQRVRVSRLGEGWIWAEPSQEDQTHPPSTWSQCPDLVTQWHRPGSGSDTSNLVSGAGLTQGGLAA